MLGGGCKDSCSGSYTYSGQELRDGYCGYTACSCTLTLSGSSVSVSANGSDNPFVTIRDSSCGEGGYTQTVTVSSNQSWCTASVITVSSSRRISVSCSANTSTSSRTATITARNECGVTQTLTITQEGARNYVFECINDPCEGRFDYEAANSSLGLLRSTKNDNPIGCSLTNNTGSSWLSVTGPVQSGVPDIYAFNVQVQQNNSSSSRSCVLTFTQNESGKTIQFPITQEGRGNCSITGTISVTSNQVNVSNLRVTSNGCGSQFSGGCLTLTLTGANFTTNGAYYTLDSSRENATIALSTTARSFSMPFQYHSGYDLSSIHVSGSRCTSGNEGDCIGCDLNYTLNGGN